MWAKIEGFEFINIASEDIDFDKLVDQSPFSRAEWLEALRLVSQWLVEQNKTSDLNTVVGYIGCCENSTKLYPAFYSLPMITAEMLTTHGFERARG